MEVASIVSAAESAAVAIRNRAEQDALARRREADAEARRVVTEAAVEADRLVVDRLRKISELSDSVVERAASVSDQLGEAEELRERLNGLLMGLAKTAERVARELGTEVRGSAAEASPPPSAGRTPKGVAPAAAPSETALADAPAAAAPTDPPASTARVVELHRPPAPEPERGAERAESRAPVGEVDGARLVALQMAVAGSTRGEVAAHLSRAFQIGEPHAILDDVFGSGSPPA